MAARGQLFLACVVLGGVVLPVARQAEAASDKYIVMLDIEGERSPRLKKSIARMVKDQYKVMEGSSYRDAARRLRAEKLTPTNVKRVCNYLEVDGVIDGTLVKDDGRYKFTLRLRSGVTGAIAKKIPMYINQPSLSQNMADQLEERLLAAIADLPRPGGGTKVKGKKGKADEDEEDEEEDEPRKMTKAEKRKAARAAAAERKAAAAEKRAAEKAARQEAAREKKEREKAERELAKKKKRKKARDEEAEEDEEEEEEEVSSRSKKRKNKKKAARDDDEEAEDEVDEDEEEDEDEPKRAAMKDAGADDEDEEATNPDLDLESSSEPAPAETSLRTTPLLVHAGVSVVGRNLTFKHSASAEDGPRGYKGKSVPGVYAAGELYPMRFAGNKGALGNVGLGFVVDRVIKLNSAVSDGMDGTTLLPTRQSRYGVNLRYRHNFGSGPRGVSLVASVGYNKLAFVIDKSGAPDNVIVDVPNTSYAYVDPGLGLRVPIAGALSGLVEAKFMAVLGTGEIQQPEQYGAATVTGVDADAGLEYAIGQHFLVRAGARLIQIGYKFKGTGVLDDRDGDGSPDVGGASDRFLGGYMTAGYAF